METTLENPVIKDESDLDQAFMEAAAAADKGEKFDLPSSAEQPEPRTPGTTEATPTSNTDTQPEKKDERPRDELGRFTKTEQGTDIPESERVAVDKLESQRPTEATGKVESPYAQKLKEIERRENVLKNFQEEKETTRRELDRERQRLAQERQQWEQQRQQTQNGDKPKYTSQDYRQYAADCTKAAREATQLGDYEKAAEQNALAADATEQALKAHDYELQTEQSRIGEFFQNSFIQEMQALRSKDPELDNPDSELGKEVVAVMGEYPIFERIPPVQMPDGSLRGGFWLASKAAQLRVENKKNAGRVSVLETQLKQITAERDDLRVRTGIGGSGPTGPTPPKRIEDMSDDEAQEYFAREAAKHDSR